MDPFEGFRAVWLRVDDLPEPDDLGAQVRALRAELAAHVTDRAALAGIRVAAKRIEVCRRCRQKWDPRLRALAPLLPALLRWRAPTFQVVEVDTCATCARPKGNPGPTSAGAD